jgi:3-phosphoshikimate 1-carboxyvinyltransferase
MTIAVMRQFGARVERDGYRVFRVAAGQRYRPQAVYDVEADASSAHYFLAAAALTGGRVRIDGVGTASLQGDARFASVLERMGASVTWREHDVTVEGPAQLRGIDVDMGDISDTALTLAVIAPFASTKVRIRNAAHLRIQESDRIAAVATELRKLGGTVTEHDDGWEIEPSSLHGGEVETYDDHRIAMAFAVVGLRVPGVVVLDPRCVNKTFPAYFDTLERLRAA